MFLYDTEKSKIFDFFEFSQNESGSFDRVSRIIQECSRRVLVMVIDFLARKRVRKSRFFDVCMTYFEEFQSGSNEN